MTKGFNLFKNIFNSKTKSLKVDIKDIIEQKLKLNLNELTCHYWSFSDSGGQESQSTQCHSRTMSTVLYSKLVGQCLLGNPE